MTRFDEFERHATTLRQIADHYASGSDEKEAIRLAAFALMFVTMDCHEQFERFVEEASNGLTEEQRSRLQRMGIDET
jgi:hypothetical protein